MENQIPWDIILEQLRNRNAKQDPRFTEWLQQSKENLQYWEELLVIYAVNGKVPEYYIPRQEVGWMNIQKRISKSIRKEKFIHYLVRIAASFLLIMLGAGGYWLGNRNTANPVYSEVVSPYGHKTMVLLPDSSVVWLNGDSRLRYQTDFSKERNVELEGEALFDVRKNPGNLFTVRSKDLRLEVYGTQFNFRTYSNDDEVEVALLEGSVGLFQDQHHLKTMKPGEVVSWFPGQSKMQTSLADIRPVISWQSDELIIDNMAIDEAFKYLERWYGVQIESADNFRSGQKLSFKVKSESLRELLSIINRITPIQYTIDGQKVKIAIKREQSPHLFETLSSVSNLREAKISTP